MKTGLRFVMAFFALIFGVSLQAQVIVPTQTDEIIIDNGASGKADPNDRIRYKVTIQNTGGATGNGVQLNAVPDPRTTLVPGSFRSSPLAINDSYTCTGNVGITVPAASGVKTNDFDDNLGITTLSVSTPPVNGAVTLNNDGSFTYIPNAGFTGNDNFAYTLTDGNPVGLPVPTTDIATVSITVSNLIWFINNSAAAGDGRRNTPFNSLTAFNAGSAAAGDVIYIEETGTNYTGGIVLQNNERLFGEGHTGGANLSNVLPFTLAPNSIALPAINGTRPVITNAGGDGVAVASDNILRGFNVGACSDFGMDNIGTNSVGNLVISEVLINNTSGGGFDASNGSGASTNVVLDALSSTGGVNGINLVGCAGTFTVNGGTITNPTGTGVAIINGSVVFSSSGVITDNTGFAVDIDNHDSGNATFSGNITSTGTGIRVQNCGGGTKLFSGASKSLTTTTNTAVTLASNTGATINITGGGLVISTTSGTGYSATGGGIISVTGGTNTITSTTGTAMNVANTTISASNLIFLSISANGAPNGIVLNTTGGSGGLSVTGTGSTNGSGGTIQNVTNRGVSATSTINLSLKNMTFNNANTTDGPGPCGAADNSGCNAAIHMNTVTTATLDNIDISGTTEQGINVLNTSNFSLTNSTLINCGVPSSGADTEESCLYAINMSGTCDITNSSLTIPSERAAVIYNTSKTMTLTVSGSTFGMNQTQMLGADGLEIDSYGASNTTLDISGCTFIQPKTNGLQVITENTSVTSVDVTGCTFDPGTGLSAAIDFVTNNTGNLKFNIVNNPLIKAKGINVVNIFAFPNSNFEGRVNNNTITLNGGGSGAGVRVNSQGNANSKIEIKNNTITGGDDYGITAIASGGTGRLDATITGNTVSLTNSGFYGIHAAAGVSSSTFTNKVCANVANNNTNGVPAPAFAIGHFQARAATATHEILLQGPGPNVATNWSSNTNTPIPGTTSQSGAGVFTFGATCLLPTNPM